MSRALPRLRARRLHSLGRRLSLTNGLSEKVVNHAHALAILFFWHNFAKIHQTLRITQRWRQG